jgi:hypothetical protein
MNRRMGLAVVLAAFALLPTAAEARWGPNQNCSQATHCYGLAMRNTQNYGSIDYSDTAGIKVYGWATGDFVTNEQWISWEREGIPGWIEIGQIIGDYTDCCTLHPFIAEEQNHKFKIEISPAAVQPNAYNHYLIFDGEHNGSWHLYWGCADAQGPEWCEVGRYGGGWPALLAEQEAGIEISANTEPYAYGRQEVAAVNEGPWYPWTGARYYNDPGIHIAMNSELPAAGNIEWAVGSLHAAAVKEEPSPSPATVASRYASTGGTVTTETSNFEGREVVAMHGSQPFRPNLPTPRGRKQPSGKVLTLVRNARGFVERLYLAEAPPTAAELRGEM